MTGKTVATCLMAVATLACCGAPSRGQEKPKPEDLLVGRWESLDPQHKGTVEFTRDGKVRIVSQEPNGKEVKFGGSYSWTDKERVTVELTFMGTTFKQVLKVQCSRDELTTTDEKGVAEKFKRATKPAP